MWEASCLDNGAIHVADDVLLPGGACHLSPVELNHKSVRRMWEWVKIGRFISTVEKKKFFRNIFQLVISKKNQKLKNYQKGWENCIFLKESKN